MSRTHLFRPRLHPMEDRTTPSCLVYVLQDSLVIRGDDLANTVRVDAQGSRVSVTCDRDPTVTYDAIRLIVADLGDGADRVVAVRTATAAAPPLLLRLSTGAGEDVVNLTWVPGGDDSIWVDLGAAGDQFAARFIPPPEPEIPLPDPDVSVRLTVQGGIGNDRITSRMGIEPTPYSQSTVFEVNADGGAGNDVLDAEFTAGATQQKVADLRVALLGGDGNDSLRLTWTPGIAFDVDAFADGGAGIDTGVFSPGVRHVNVERLG